MLKTIKDSFDWKGEKVNFVYQDADSFDQIDVEKVRQCYGVCFLDGKIVVVGYEDHWSLPGGTREKGESIEETLRREIKEETNMEILRFMPVGYQHILGDGTNDFYQLRFVCSVKPYGEFKKDIGGEVIKNELISPADFDKYVKWGKVGERILERSLELKKDL